MDRISDLIKGKKRLPRKMEQIMRRYGDNIIDNIHICRQPIQAIIKKFINIASVGDLERNIEKYSYDDLYHLSMRITTKQNSFKLEKNERLNMTVDNSELSADTTCIPVEIQSGITLNELIEKTMNQMGNDFYNYDAEKNNCQDFIANILGANGLLHSKYREFIKQDAENLVFKEHPELSKFAKGITDIAATAKDVEEAIDEFKESATGKIISTIAHPIINNLFKSPFGIANSLTKFVEPREKPAVNREEPDLITQHDKDVNEKYEELLQQ